MLLLTILAIGLLAYANYRIGGKSAFYPPVVFCGVWGVALGLCWAARDFFYPLSVESLAIFLAGCVAFSTGSWLAFLVPAKPPAQTNGISKASNRVLTILVVLLAIAAPICFRWLVGYTSDSGGPNYLRAVYLVLSEEANQRDSRVSLLLNIVTLSNMVALLAFLERGRSRTRAILAMVVAFALNVMTGGRAGFTGLVFSLICLDWLKTRRIRWKMMTAVFIAFFVASSVVAVYVQKGDTSPDASIVDNAAPVVELFVAYAAGGVVAFDQFVRDPNVVPVNWSVDRFFLQTLDKFGAHYDVPDVKAGFVTVGPHNLTQNVYTLYFGYWSLGKLGMMLLLLVIGFLVAWCYREAIAGAKTASIMYSLLFGGILLSIFFEPFFFVINVFFKVYLLCWLLYQLPPLFHRFSVVVRHAVQANMASTKLPGN